MLLSRLRIAAVALLSIAAVAALPAGAVAKARHANAIKHKVGHGTSTNWSGYAVGGTNATHVIGTWTQPTATCSARENSWSSPWVGIDGNTSNTVEQIGTDTDCSNGVPSYYAWYEMYPQNLVVISIPVNHGNSFTGEVTGDALGNFVLRLTNNTTHNTFSTTQSASRAKRSSVEWVMEGPSNGGLTNFGSVGFTGTSATISGQSGTVGSFGNAQPITMVTRRGGVQRAVPSQPSGDAFSVGWLHG